MAEYTQLLAESPKAFEFAEPEPIRINRERNSTLKPINVTGIGGVPLTRQDPSAGCDSQATCVDDSDWVDESRIWIRAVSNPRANAPFQRSTQQPCRTLVLCFDGTGDQFDGDVALSYLVPNFAVCLNLILFRTPTSSSS